MDGKVLSFQISAFLLIVISSAAVFASAELCSYSGGVVYSDEDMTIWYLPAGYKVFPDTVEPGGQAQGVFISSAANETESAQLVIRSKNDIKNLRFIVSELKDESGSVISPNAVSICFVDYVNITRPTDKSGKAGMWPDPILPMRYFKGIKANTTQGFWVTVKVPKGTSKGFYRGEISITAQGRKMQIPLYMEVFGFELPDKMTCTTAFGLSWNLMWKYHNVKSLADKKILVDKYFQNLAEHHISPYNPAPLARLKVIWPNVKVPADPLSKWENLRVAHNERASGESALVIFDDDKSASISVSYKDLLEIPQGGFVLSFDYKTALEDQAFLVSFGHYDADGKWMSGKNNDIAVKGTGKWEHFERKITRFAEGAKFVRLTLRPVKWTSTGDQTGIAWFDNVSLRDAVSGKEFLTGGDFERPRRTQPIVPAEKLQVKIDANQWTSAMRQAFSKYHFNSFRLSMPGLGGGTYHSMRKGSLLGFTDDTPEYKIMLASYCRGMQGILEQNGLLKYAYIYWFDEPSEDQYKFVKNGFLKLKQYCPKIDRMLTEKPDPRLFGGPNIWCIPTYHYQQKLMNSRKAAGEKLWWYLCTGPKYPYCTLFIDHAGTELRVWLWQSWQRGIDGILVWRINYWHSDAAYPDTYQNPYEDPMSWVSGYSTPKGKRRPWGNGDGRFIYPPPEAATPAEKPVLQGPVNSVRWEALRDGIEDYEYLAMLKRLLQKHRNTLNSAEYKRYLALLEVPDEITSSMTKFTKKPEPILIRRTKIAEAIETLLKIQN